MAYNFLNFEKCWETDRFCSFCLHKVVFATAAGNFSTSELQKLLRNWHDLHISTTQCAFRHTGVQFLVSPLSSYLCTRLETGLLVTEPLKKKHHFGTFLTFGAKYLLSLTFALLHVLSAALTITFHYKGLLQYFKVLVQHYFVLQSTTTPYYKLLLQYSSMVQRTTPYYKEYHSTSTSLYKVVVQYYKLASQLGSKLG